MEYHRGGGDGNQLKARRNGDVDGEGGRDSRPVSTVRARVPGMGRGDYYMYILYSK